MMLNYWAGVITPELIQQHTRIDTWALGWLRIAETAELQGRRLIVFEVPQELCDTFVREFDLSVQYDYGLLPTGLLMPE